MNLFDDFLNGVKNDTMNAFINLVNEYSIGLLILFVVAGFALKFINKRFYSVVCFALGAVCGVAKLCIFIGLFHQ